ncbi:MAG: 16S rRNA (guanine527-N7)-methyltransferase [Granulosicoccus sp.]
MESANPSWDIVLKHFPDITPEQQSLFERLYEVYLEWNAQINVISRKDTHLFYERHVLHSLAIAKLLPFTDGTMVLDVGTGGGFPGIPLAILYPNCTFHLVDSIAKKIKVVKDVAEQLGLDNVKAEQARAEELKFRYDVIVTRAVAPLASLAGWTKGKLIKKSNQKITGLICLKGGDLTEEIIEAKMKPKLFNLADHFEGEFFETKKLIWVKKV